MKLTLNELNSIAGVLNNFTQQKMNFKLSYKIMKISSRIDEELNFYQKELQSLLEDCALRDENNQIIFTEDKENVKLKEDKIEEFNSKYTELTNMEIEIEDKFQLTLEELENLEISPIDIFKLEPIIKE